MAVANPYDRLIGTSRKSRPRHGPLPECDAEGRSSVDGQFAPLLWNPSDAAEDHAHDHAVPDLGFPPIAGDSAAVAGRRGRRARVELRPARTSRSVRLGGAILKGLGFAALALILLEPLLTGSRPRRGANAFVSWPTTARAC